MAMLGTHCCRIATIKTGIATSRRGADAMRERAVELERRMVGVLDAVPTPELAQRILAQVCDEHRL